MKASILDLRYRMHDVLKALDRNEEVQVLYHGKLKGRIRSVSSVQHRSVTDHPFFNSAKTKISVLEEMGVLRGGRYRDL